MIYQLLLLAIAAIVSAVSADTTLVTITNPVNNQVLIPNQQVIVQYTINGVPGQCKYLIMFIPSALYIHFLLKYTAYPPKEIINYPNSLKMEFKWVSKNNTSTAPIQLTALSGLSAEPSAGGLKNVTYSHRWKLPNCHFFRRYMPSEWSFSIVVEPQYAADLPPPPSTNNIATKKHAAAVIIPLGPKQPVITIPFDVSFNLTRMNEAHHTGC